MTYLPAKNPPWKDESNPLGPPSNASIATDLSAEAMDDLETRVEDGLAAAVAAATAAGALASAIPWPVKALIPLYIYPTYLGSFWDVIEANPTGVGYIVANPNSGPGNAPNSDYTTHINNMRAKGVKVLAYVDTAFTVRALADVKADMDSWASFYSIDGYFFDDCTNVVGVANAAVTYMQALRTYSQGKSADYITVNNYGTTFPSVFMPTADIHVSTEQSEANVLANVPSTVGYEYMWSYPPTRFCHLVYNGTLANLQSVLAAAVKRHSAYVYVSEATLAANPWLTPPSFWTTHQKWLGGFGITPYCPPVVTGSKGSNAALTSLMTRLSQMGFIIDSTT